MNKKAGMTPDEIRRILKYRFAYQYRAADRLKISESLLSNLIAGRRTDREKRKALAKLLKVNPEQMWGK